MARPKSFDEKRVLDAAVDCFWRNGLKSASIRDLAEEMGIAGPSLYNAYGCKRALFVEALRRYGDERTAARIIRLERKLAPKAAIRAFFAETIDNAASASGMRGCFIVNSAMEVPADDAELAALVSAYLEDIRQFFERCLIAGQAAGDIRKELDAPDTARLLLAVLLGLRVLARTRPGRAALEAAIRPALALLDMPSTTVREVER